VAAAESLPAEDVLYYIRGMITTFCQHGNYQNRAKARRMWKEAADSGEILSNIALGDDCAARGDNGRALLYYRRARSNAAHMPDIEYTPRVCLRLAQYETRYTSRQKAPAASWACISSC